MTAPTNDAPVAVEQWRTSIDVPAVEQRHRDAAAWAMDRAPDSLTWDNATASHVTPDRRWQMNRVAEAMARMERDTIARHRLAAPASAPAPSWSNTPEHIRDHLTLLAEVELHLQSSRVFVTTREKMHPCGVELHDELLGKVTAAIETIGKGQAHG